MPHAPAPLTSFLAPWALLLLPVLAVYFPQGLVLVLVLLMLVRLGECWRAGVWPAWRRPSIFLGLAISGWAAMSTFWALQPSQAFMGALGLLAFVVQACFCRDGVGAMPVAARQWALAGFVAGAAIAAVLLGADIVSHGALAGLIHQYDIADASQRELALRSLNRGASFLALLCPFVALVAGRSTSWNGRFGVLMALGLILVVVLLRGKDAMVLGLVVTAISAVIGWFAPSRGRQAMMSVLVVLAVAAPVAARQLPDPQWMWSHWHSVSQSILHRLVIWRFTAEQIAVKPVLGWGMNSAKVIPGGGDDVIVSAEGEEVRWRLLPLHPHNAVLQWWLELGVVGVGLLTALALCLIAVTNHFTQRGLGAAVQAFGANFIVISLVSFGAWQSWWLASLVIGMWLTSLAAAAPAGASCQPILSQEAHP